MKTKSFIYAALWVAVFLGISSFIGGITQAGMGWYDTLEKSALTPPRLAFPIVWSGLYIMLGIAGYILYTKRQCPWGRQYLSLFWGYMLINWAWSFIFFGAHLVTFGFWWIVLAETILGTLIISLWRHKQKTLFYLLLPTFMWGVFAAYLNGYIAF